MVLTEYYEEICKYKLIPIEEEQRLFKVYHDPESTQLQKKQAKDAIINANLRYVFKKAKDYTKNDPTQFEDLIAAGNEGLVVGFNKFDHLSGYKFLTYAGWWIMQRQLKAMSTVRVVALPIWKQQLSSRLLKAQEKREIPLTIDELCEKFPDVKRKDIEELTKTRYLTYYMDDVSENETLINPFEDMIDSEVEAEKVQRLLTKIPEDQAAVLRLAFGFSDGKDKKPTSISRELSMSKEEIRTLHKKGLENLKKLLRGRTG